MKNNKNNTIESNAIASLRLDENNFSSGADNITAKATKLLSIKEVCSLTGVSRRTVYRLINSKELEAHKLRRLTRITSDSYEAWIKKTPWLPKTGYNHI